MSDVACFPICRHPRASAALSVLPVLCHPDDPVHPFKQSLDCCPARAQASCLVRARFGACHPRQLDLAMARGQHYFLALPRRGSPSANRRDPFSAHGFRIGSNVSAPFLRAVSAAPRPIAGTDRSVRIGGISHGIVAHAKRAPACSPSSSWHAWNTPASRRLIRSR